MLLLYALSSVDLHAKVFHMEIWVGGKVMIFSFITMTLQLFQRAPLFI